MKSKFTYIVLTVLSILLIIGCSNKQGIDNAEDRDRYEGVKAIAWAYLNEKGWQEEANDDLQTAKVRETTADSKYILLDKNDDGKAAFEVSFEDKENTATGTPLILIDTKMNKVIGYMPSE